MSTSDDLSKLQLLRTELSIVNIKMREWSKGRFPGVDGAVKIISEQAEPCLGLQEILFKQSLENYCRIAEEYRQPI